KVQVAGAVADLHRQDPGLDRGRDRQPGRCGSGQGKRQADRAANQTTTRRSGAGHREPVQLRAAGSVPINKIESGPAGPFLMRRLSPSRTLSASKRRRKCQRQRKKPKWLIASIRTQALWLLCKTSTTRAVICRSRRTV